MLKQRKLRLIGKYFFECEMFDFRYGITTARHIDKEDLGVLSDNLNAGIGYVSSWPSTFKQALHSLDSAVRDIPELTFIDFGSGMGKVCFLADFEIRNHYQGDLRIIGIEYSPMMFQSSIENMKILNSAGKLSNKIEFENLDCADYDYSGLSENLLIYMYNPFDEGLIKKIFANFSSQHVWIIYVNPVHLDTFVEIGFKVVVYLDAWHPNAQFAVLSNS